ncbi:cullin, a subunit of E3 ubiquitin ligase [Mycobacteroides abscessus subsp. abscessus]|nr:cullin, a subunit of E3 ubiquitin ligase [Mycobacteroides abscessus subsp. abscessus]
MAAWLASGRRGVVAGLAASNLHGASWVDHDVPIELVGVKCRQQEGLIARNERIGADEITRISGLPVTHRVRTAFDLGRYQPRTRAMGCLDALMRNQVFALDEVAGLSQRYPKVRGVRQLRELLPLIDAGAGLPRAQTQVPVFDGYTPIAFLDIGWPQYLVAVEYDGDHHRRDRRQYVKDLARLRMLEERGWIVIRVIAEESPGAWIARTTAALRSRGCHIEIDEMQRSTRPFAA